MSSTKFQIIEHIIDGQHIREYPNATRYQDDCALKLHIKQYKPLNNLEPKPDSMVIIAAAGNGFPKEIYEPLWDDLLDQANSVSLPIRAIWIADSSHQGSSGIINEDAQGDDPSYYDLSRDLLHMVNVFRSEMKSPIFGIAHSMGAVQVAHLSLLHPRLFHSLALIEPVIQDTKPVGPNPAMFANMRPDLFVNRQAAANSLRKHPMFKSFDPRALKRYVEVGFRDLPTRLYPDISKAQALLAKTSKGNIPKDGGPPVTLATTKHQEAWSYVRPNFTPMPVTQAEEQENRLTSPDADMSWEGAYIFIRPEILQTHIRLPELRPAVLWLCGEDSYINSAEVRARKSETGKGRGGSGGFKASKVEEVVVSNQGHMLPLDNPTKTASILVEWLQRRHQAWKDETKFYKQFDSKKSSDEGLKLSRHFNELAMQPIETLRPKREKL